jgi:predicted nucleic acid-binding protein
MEIAPGYLIDTNILLRLSRQSDSQHMVVKEVLGRLDEQGEELYFALQNITEFWNVCTRPTERNGYGLSIAETNRCVEDIERSMIFLPDNEHVYSIWRRLVIDNHVRGVQVHDARLVAVMQAYGLTRILTLNQPDFSRYLNLQVVHPRQLQPFRR